MAGPQDFINPIIQAIISSREAQGRQASLAEETRAHQAEEKQRAQQLQQTHEEFTLRQAEEAKVHESEAEFRKAQALHAQTQQSLAFYDALRSGAVVPQAASQFIPGAKYNPPQQIIPQSAGGGLQAPGSITLPGGQEISESQLPSPERMMQQAAQSAGMIKSAELAVAEPYIHTHEVEAQTQAIKLAKMHEDATNLRTLYTTESADTRSALENQMQYANSHERVGADYARINAEYGMDPGQTAALSVGVLSGKIDPSKLPKPIADRISSHIVGQGGDPNAFSKIPELQALDQTNNAFQRIADYANQYGSTSKVGAASSGATAALTDPNKKAAYEAMMPDIFNLGKTLQGYSGSARLAKMFDTDSASMPHITDTFGQIQTKLKTLVQKRDERLQEITGGMTPEQKNRIGQDNSIKLLQPQPTQPQPTQVPARITHIWTPNGGIQPVPVGQGQQ